MRWLAAGTISACCSPHKMLDSFQLLRFIFTMAKMSFIFAVRLNLFALFLAEQILFPQRLQQLWAVFLFTCNSIPQKHLKHVFNGLHLCNYQRAMYKRTLGPLFLFFPGFHLALLSIECDSPDLFSVKTKKY